MKIPGLDDMLTDFAERGDKMQETLDRIVELLTEVKENSYEADEKLRMIQIHTDDIDQNTKKR